MVLEKVQARINESEGKRSPGFFGGGRATAKTRKKYQHEEVLDSAYHNAPGEDEVRVCVGLAVLADKINLVETAGLKEAFETGRLMLTRSDLPGLLQLGGASEREAWLGSRLADQI